MECEPFYEVTGPDAKYIRQDVFAKFKTDKITDEELEAILLKNIPDSKNDFGSWRGYATFGLDEALFNNITKDIIKLTEEKLEN